ncbi:hypothetical protein D3C84_1021510 [compost metagenome]
MVPDEDLVQGDVNHITVRIELRYLDPIAQAHDLTGGNLNAGDQAVQRGLKDQYRDRRQGAETGKHDQR